MALFSVALGVVSIFAVIFISVYLFLTRNFNVWKKSGIPYEKPLPFFGSIKDAILQNLDIGQTLKKIYDKHREKPYVGFFSFDQPSLLLIDTELVKKVLVKDAHNFINRVQTADEKGDPLTGRAIFALKNEKWKRVRSAMSPIFTLGKMKKMFYIVEEISKKFDDFMDEETARAIDGDDFVAQSFAFLSAGFETSSTTMTFTLYEMALHPDLQTRLRKDIMGGLAKFNNELTYEAIIEMQYLDMVVNETLRKYPIVPYLDRMTVNDFQLPSVDGKGTVTIKSGVGIYVPVYALHHDPEYFPNPAKFDPERFTEENKKKIPQSVYLPFGEGPRFCLGMKFGLMQTKIGLIHVFSRFEVAPCKDTPIPLKIHPKPFLIQAERLCIFISLPVIIYLFLIRHFNYWKNQGIPYTKPVPLFGSLKDVLLQKIHVAKYFKEIYDKYKNEPYVGIFAIDQPGLLIRDLEVLKTILVKDAGNFADRMVIVDENVSPLNAKTLMAMKGQKWRHVRTSLTPTFTSGKLKKAFYIVDKCCKQLVELVDKTAVNGEFYSANRKVYSKPSLYQEM
ncbi:hypothetical protein C0J52_26728 [Blattella germanica]|nr:hypothetical protein C0J52_26728 [Blattella germanica]